MLRVPELWSDRASRIHYDLYLKELDELKGYVKQHPEIAGLSFEEITKTYVGDIGRIACQALNHTHFFRCIANKTPMPKRILSLILGHYKSLDDFYKDFATRALSSLSPSWIWLAYDPDTSMLRIIVGENAYNPVLDGYKPLLVLDMWEHAYLLDYGLDREEYIANFWKVVDWRFVDGQLDR